jgi:hypothetical protein
MIRNGCQWNILEHVGSSLRTTVVVKCYLSWRYKNMLPLNERLALQHNW